MALHLSYEIFALLFAVALIAGFIDAIAGGGGLLVLPVLLSVGLLPAEALATNKLQSSGGALSASVYFVRRKAVNLFEQRWNIACTFVGASLGVCLVQLLKADFLAQMLPVLIIAVGVYFLLTPKIGVQDSQQRISSTAFGLIAGTGIGFYDGFFGPGTGSFLALAFVLLQGFNLAKATAHAKVLNFVSNLAALIFFIIGGQVVWAIGLVMIAGQFIGAHLGANLVLTKGPKLIRPMLICVSTIMSCKLIYDQHGAQIAQWFS